MNLNNWATKWGVSFEAVEDLRREMGEVDPFDIPNYVPGESEAAVQAKVRLEASRKGARLWRNNVGGAYTADEYGRNGTLIRSGSFLRYGLCNSSEAENKAIKSSDLIGLRPIQIKQHHIGYTFGVFVAREVKPANWQYTGTDREKAQLKFLEIVASLGGDAAFTVGEGTL